MAGNGNGSDNGWKEWSKHVLAELKRLNTCYEQMNGTIQEMKVEIATLKVKSGVWGAMAGLVPGLAAVIYVILKTAGK